MDFDFFNLCIFGVGAKCSRAVLHDPKYIHNNMFSLRILVFQKSCQFAFFSFNFHHTLG